MTTEIFTLQELSREIGVALNIIAYHRKLGDIPEPLWWGGRRVYDPDGFATSVAFFRGRKRYQRRAKTTVASKSPVTD